ncbi:hypothetical protein EDB87DRAFT_1207877 [Lactarius vividus]|nr:hypothetical protein EDB87DRAFT_1207877 [Lactarius vividus]
MAPAIPHIMTVHPTSTYTTASRRVDSHRLDDTHTCAGRDARATRSRHPYQRVRSLSCVHQRCRVLVPLGRSAQQRVSSSAKAVSMQGNNLGGADEPRHAQHGTHDTRDLRDPRSESAALVEGSRVQRHITEVYEQYCTHMGDNWECGIHLIDWLSSKIGRHLDRQYQ